ncbi:MAG TPA: DegT/DnrJ/EryC1/StrS family aminotransferase [Actinomycetes bacterium]|jgi:dTDP-4-amino-4,6-dideoxygalactose transaminase|nr:DegT/DnrJ/EryC1/StrS family aminotransferase [Actinomycetes bacterium]
MTMGMPAFSSAAGRPAIRGGRPLFPDGLPLARPAVADPELVAKATHAILTSGVLTNGPTVRDLEERAAEYLGVRHCIAVASCTAGLMLVLRGSRLSGDVVLPSFTFSATAHAVAWNGLRPVFADIRPDSLLLDPAAAARATGMRTSAILATHTYGTPCDVEELGEVASRNGIRLFFDAAHAFGSRRGAAMVGGFGDAEVFSLSPTKVLIAGEGGIIATNDDILAERCRIGRDYGNPGDYDTRFVGLNARMSEMHAATALASFDDLEERIERRNQLAARYREVLAGLPGIRFPLVADGDRSTYKDFTVLVDADGFGMDADAAAKALAAEGIQTRRYYAPPVHRQRAYRALAPTNGSLPVTDAAAARALTLPLWTGMRDQEIDGVGAALARLAAPSPTG